MHYYVKKFSATTEISHFFVCTCAILHENVSKKVGRETVVPFSLSYIFLVVENGGW